MYPLVNELRQLTQTINGWGYVAKDDPRLNEIVGPPNSCGGGKADRLEQQGPVRSLLGHGVTVKNPEAGVAPGPHELVIIFLFIALAVAGLKIVQLDRRLALVESQAVTNLFVNTEAMKTLTDVKLLSNRMDQNVLRVLTLEDQVDKLSQKKK